MNFEIVNKERNHHHKYGSVCTNVAVHGKAEQTQERLKMLALMLLLRCLTRLI
jgi:hypothetical protein